MEQDKAEVFCIDTGVTKKVELPEKYKEKDMTKVFSISLEGVKLAGASTMVFFCHYFGLINGCAPFSHDI